MFEKESKEYAIGLTYPKFQDSQIANIVLRDVEGAFQKGAELAYNKANEWHEIESKISPKREISKKYMPKNEEKVLLKYHFYDDDEVHISDGYYDAYDFQFHIANNPKFRIVCVIAWKELPKENG